MENLLRRDPSINIVWDISESNVAAAIKNGCTHTIEAITGMTVIFLKSV